MQVLPDIIYDFFYFFLFIHYSHATYQIMARLCTVRFLSAVRAVAARCKLPSALRPGLSQEDVVRTKEITKERRTSVKDKGKNEGKNTAQRLNRSCGRHEVGRGQEQWSPPDIIYEKQCNVVPACGQRALPELDWTVS